MFRATDNANRLQFNFSGTNQNQHLSWALPRASQSRPALLWSPLQVWLSVFSIQSVHRRRACQVLLSQVILPPPASYKIKYYWCIANTRYTPYIIVYSYTLRLNYRHFTCHKDMTERYKCEDATLRLTDFFSDPWALQWFFPAADCEKIKKGWIRPSLGMSCSNNHK